MIPDKLSSRITFKDQGLLLKIPLKQQPQPSNCFLTNAI